MSIEDQINVELARSKLLPLVEEQVQCLHDPARMEEAAGMLADLRDRCGVRLPLPAGDELGGPYEDEEQARAAASLRLPDYPVVTVDEMATGVSRSTGEGNEFYVTGYAGAQAAVALAQQDQWVALWLSGEERV